MCGIVGYIGKKEAFPIIIKGLQRLEYRGYDSAGVALLNGDLNVYKKQGKVSALKEYVQDKDVSANVGIGHTRWATHGEPNDVNAHPHVSNSGKFAMIHNGIIENYAALKTDLEKKGYTFQSETDTEVFINFIEDIFLNTKVDLAEAVRLALNKVIGAYAIAIISLEDPNLMIAARKGSPLVVGLGKEEFFLASDATPIIEYTNEVVYLDDREIAIIKDGKLTIKNVEDVEMKPYVQTVDIELEAIEKAGYDHFMLKEIFEQPKSIGDCLRGRLNAKEGHLHLGGINDYVNKISNADRILIVACGTSWHAGLVAEYIFEEYCRIPVEVEYASEFRYRNPIVGEKDVVIAISQSGETADTLAAIELAKSKGATILGVCNVVGASIPRTSHAGSYTHAGPEIGVASTKAFTAQISVLTMMALMLAHKKGSLTESEYRKLLVELEAVPDKVAKCLDLNAQIEIISEKFKDAANFLYLGRGYNFPVALEGALKLKEISYIHAEGYPAAEMKHGPIALIDENMPVVFIATKDSSYEKIVSNIQEVKARKGKVIAIVTEGDTDIAGMADYTVEVPAAHESLMPLISVIPLQLLSYHIAVMRGCNVDQPRNLAKSVTVE
ncbi:glutamine--fructose-6-phosphate transaminase [Roseivirga pacifica]|uniref:Glutamine--fructose-6-phosphate aminotransferase [isomerizing] n=1 Tax=Roseivirga pacifica TaxID=1267423 RepID=A0A1I0NGX2_9BACT|nr:glutamine--fructose-6-phosphate transaminase (isomerizing) [Roseivirga pacifica]MCO6359712.1 glutamine--fructose-6-phosphate transaminase (isomerizing) [Roseivirga pacifica]MCO6367082.1 glutamine--fructose-6-phosphate transaminase (isomerizing) [Roseivirga pacifica]MCO6370386.1 glutamine--fructose-6-phosphate transaminase (isomerizing) [Roseivirga pacifica]MCO6374739.1 glutamine--fructose-6-phosphate transaminase (isomerizing) [Roseivirga pacifica]MCO6379997.1 glutamine--fructose-6-phosphat